MDKWHVGWMDLRTNEQIDIWSEIIGKWMFEFVGIWSNYMRLDGLTNGWIDDYRTMGG